MKLVVSLFAVALGVSSAVACSSGGSSSSSGSSSGSSGGGETDCAKLSTAACAKFDTCFAGTLTGLYGDATKCATALAESCNNEKSLEGSALKTKGAACSDEFAAATCDAIFDGNGAPSCSKGTLASGAKCVRDGQCATGYCKATASTSSCGTCAEPLAEGAVCETECGGSGLVCSAGKCAKRGAAGADCGSGKPPCVTSLSCVAGKCAEGKAAGAACTPAAQDCKFGLVCAGTTCQAITYAAVGQPCGFVGGSIVSCSAGGSCKITGAAGVCEAAAGKGEACGTGAGAKSCVTPYSCVDGKCGFTDPASCK